MVLEDQLEDKVLLDLVPLGRLLNRVTQQGEACKGEVILKSMKRVRIRGKRGKGLLT